MEQFIGCDAHKKFSVFVAVNEKGQAGEALRVNHERPLYREFLARLPPVRRSQWKPAVATVGWSMRWRGRGTTPSYAIRTRQSGAWGLPTRRTSSMRKDWRSFCETEHCRKCGFRPAI